MAKYQFHELRHLTKGGLPADCNEPVEKVAASFNDPMFMSELKRYREECFFGEISKSNESKTLAMSIRFQYGVAVSYELAKQVTATIITKINVFNQYVQNKKPNSKGVNNDR